MKDDLSKYVNAYGDFELPNFLHHRFNTLMKSTLDLGNLACSDANQLRAFKETVKRNFKTQWLEIAKLLEAYDWISPCSCSDNDYCRICGGSRFVTNNILNSDVIDETAEVYSQDPEDDLVKKLREGHNKAIRDTRHIL
jgi:hypothetical protein